MSQDKYSRGQTTKPTHAVEQKVILPFLLVAVLMILAGVLAEYKPAILGYHEAELVICYTDLICHNDHVIVASLAAVTERIEEYKRHWHAVGYTALWENNTDLQQLRRVWKWRDQDHAKATLQGAVDSLRAKRLALTNFYKLRTNSRLASE
jgi:hypothetical protein